MADKETNIDLQEVYKTALEEAKKKALSKMKSKEEEEEGEEEHEEEEEEDEEESSKKAKKSKVEEEVEETEELATEETLAASSLHPAARSISDPKSKFGMMQSVLGAMNGMSKGDLTHWYKATMAQFGPGKDYGVGDNSAKNASTIDMKPSAAVASGAPKTAYPMPKLGMKEDVEEMFGGEELSEDFKEKATTLFEAAVNARVIAEAARIEEEYAEAIAEQIAEFTAQTNDKLDSYLNFAVENWMNENEVAIESTIRNELMEEFVDGLKTLFAEHYINVPNEKVDVLEALAEKVSVLEGKLDETINENVELRNEIANQNAVKIFESYSNDLTLTQQEKFAALVEGIEFNGDLDTYEKKLAIIKENYFKSDVTSYSSNINEETFEGEIGTTTVNVDPNVNRYVQAISRSVKK